MKTKYGLGAASLFLIGPAIYLIMVAFVAATAIAAPSPEPFILGEWEEIPKVILCEDSPASTITVKKGIEWWENRGHRFNIISLSEDNRAKQICKNVWDSYPAGYIVITKFVQEAKRDQEDLAITYVSKNHTSGTVRYAKVFFKADRLMERIIEHELGHALGFRHLKEKGHMMYPFLPYGGWNDKGLRR